MESFYVVLIRLVSPAMLWLQGQEFHLIQIFCSTFTKIKEDIQRALFQQIELNVVIVNSKLLPG